MPPCSKALTVSLSETRYLPDNYPYCRS
jgi:hypothetical protein